MIRLLVAPCDKAGLARAVLWLKTRLPCSGGYPQRLKKISISKHNFTVHLNVCVCVQSTGVYKMLPLWTSAFLGTARLPWRYFHSLEPSNPTRSELLILTLQRFAVKLYRALKLSVCRGLQLQCEPGWAGRVSLLPKATSNGVCFSCVPA